MPARALSPGLVPGGQRKLFMFMTLVIKSSGGTGEGNEAFELQPPPRQPTASPSLTVGCCLAAISLPSPLDLSKWLPFAQDRGGVGLSSQASGFPPLGASLKRPQLSFQSCTFFRGSLQTVSRQSGALPP